MDNKARYLIYAVVCIIALYYIASGVIGLLSNDDIGTNLVPDDVVQTSTNDINIEQTEVLEDNAPLTYMSEVTYTTSDTYYNEIGEVLVLMYHGLTPKDNSNDKIHRSIEGFKDDLQSLYDKNYRLISLDDYINGNLNTPEGTTPVVLTFDDGLSTAFSLVKDGDTYKAKENTALWIIEEFSKNHEDFGKTATFFIYNKYDQFVGEGDLYDRFSYLLNLGYDLGNHSYSHSNIAELSKEDAIKEIGLNHTIMYNYGEYNSRAYAYAYGGYPEDDEYLEEIFSNSYNGLSYKYDIAFLATPDDNLSSNPYSLMFNKYKVPRIRGTNNEYYDLRYWLNHFDRNPKQRYFSDGDDKKISVPLELFEKVDIDKVNNKGLNVDVIIYE
ncbi:MAG: polysaccharide deacetylase family protein [Lachnospirales bacterium]